MKIEILRLNHQGDGIGYIDDKITFVHNALPGEIVNVKIIKSHKKFNEAIVTKYIKTSINRVNTPCKYYDICGGCQTMHMLYKYELEFKENKVKEVLCKNLGIDEDLIKGIIPSSKEYHYRNKITLNSGSYHSKIDNNLIKIDECLLADNSIKVSNDKKIIRSTVNDIISLNDLKFVVKDDAFFQVNTLQAINMYDYIKSYLCSKDNVIDLYCGTASIGIYVSSNVNRVLGVEINESASKCAKENIEINNIKNVEVICSDSAYLSSIDASLYNTIIVDPPRSGLSKEVIEALVNNCFNKLIYVSCDVFTLARDLNSLKLKYDIEEIKMFDMFPKTYHVECVVLLEGKIL